MSTFVPCSLFRQSPMLKENSLLLVNQQIRFEFKQPCQDFFTSPCTIYRPLHFFGFSRHFPIRRTCLSFTKNEFNNYLCDCDLDKVCNCCQRKLDQRFPTYKCQKSKLFIYLGLWVLLQSSFK